MPRSPGSFGVHHAKLMILLRHDNTAQIVIHTAITSLDWYGTRNAIWCSPLLPRLGQRPQHSQASTDPAAAIGHTFKKDLIEYLRAYNARSRAIGTLPGRLGGYDFSAVRAALVASVPGRYPAGGAQSDRWGWPGLRRLLSTVPAAPGASDVVAQVSAVATLGSTDEWLSRCLRPALATTAPEQEDVPGASEPNLKILFPTAEDVRRSAGGHSAGAGVLTSISTPQQIKQLAYLRPFLCRQGRGVPRSACGKRAPDGYQTCMVTNLVTYVPDKFTSAQRLPSPAGLLPLYTGSRPTLTNFFILTRHASLCTQPHRGTTNSTGTSSSMPRKDIYQARTRWHRLGSPNIGQYLKAGMGFGA